MGEPELIEGCKRKDPKAQRSLYEQYANRMLSVCIRYVSDYELAEDMLQEGFVKIFNKVETFRGEGSFAGWIRRIFVTTCLEYLRKNNPLKFNIDIEEYRDIEDGTNISAISKLNADDLMQCIDRLPVGYRTVFNLYAIEGYSHKEISQMLKIKENSSQSQLTRARKLLQREIATQLDQNQ